MREIGGNSASLAALRILGYRRAGNRHAAPDEAGSGKPFTADPLAVGPYAQTVLVAHPWRIRYIFFILISVVCQLMSEHYPASARECLSGVAFDP